MSCTVTKSPGPPEAPGSPASPGSPEIALQRLERLIATRCREAMGDSTSVVLYGGYGRGEGAWFRNERGEWRPYNDFDVVLVGANRVNSIRLRELRRSLTFELPVRWVDLSWVRSGQFYRLKPTVLHYE